MKNEKQKIIVILGQTATGKSDMSVSIAKKFNGEIISADSRQVYKGLDIGTGKITKKEMQGIKHFLLDVENPTKIFTIAQFKKLANEKIENILKRNKTPIVVGGTGFYIDALINNTSLPEVPPNTKLRKELDKKSLEELQNILKKLDRNRFESIDLKNKVRLVRAIEIAKKLGSVPKFENSKSRFDVIKIGLKVPDNELRERIYKRIILRIKKGMIKEAKVLLKKGLSLKRMRELGLEYRYLADFLDKKINRKELISILDKEIWQYAKRQNTWFKRDKTINWFDPKNKTRIMREIGNFLDS